ncbi:MAG TPA: APC family permease [Lachnospiraceae bacterium]|uniref:Amino acid/polyamine/organocation transporter (APC superfamily) n=1 Tax=Muricomes intestini TaxID=1796634 RepID=A0A4R3KDC1_9FIRM|nr:APC family permease [Muricomes intestini]TCS80641.1 amino acid/polyamine/organocation transporter (APC superfamily) [Muricomes intestini]HCR83134.1 APC family permease [Lachnospiraceae bacterium]
MNIKDVLLGRPLKNNELAHEKLSKLWGLPILASDAVSSVAYAIEEILLVLIPLAGAAAFHFVPYVVIPILLLLLILVFSYSQIIQHYPQGGGAYAVARENIGDKAALLTAAALIIDYIMTVAVSISSSTAALVSAFPVFQDYKVVISLVSVSIITLINLRGAREASKIFGLPTYIFIFSMVILIIVGFFRLATGSLHPIEYSAGVFPRETLQGIGILILLKAFSSGCSAMSGIEAVSNSVPSFKDPAVHNAKMILCMLGGIIVFIFGGISLLTINLKVGIVPGHTVLSQLSSAVFGHTFMFYVIQIFTSLILILAANTAYNGLPQLLYILAHDGYVPRQFASRGTKLSFSNGIMFIYVISSLLIIGFQSETHKMVPLYSVGVFISFTVAQFSMFLKWRKLKEKGWQYKCWINGIGAIVTLVVSVIVFSTKFADGAWMLGIAIPFLMYLMHSIHKHYAFIGHQLALTPDKFDPYNKVSSTQCIIMVHDVNKPFLKAINYANSISNNVSALHICRHPEHAENLRKQWEEFQVPCTLRIIETPYRDIIKPMDEYLWKREKALKPGENISVIVIKFMIDHWYDNILHNQTTYFISHHLSKHKNISTVVLPFHYDLHHVEKEEQAALKN